MYFLRCSDPLEATLKHQNLLFMLSCGFSFRPLTTILFLTAFICSIVPLWPLGSARCSMLPMQDPQAMVIVLLSYGKIINAAAPSRAIVVTCHYWVVCPLRLYCISCACPVVSKLWKIFPSSLLNTVYIFSKRAVTLGNLKKLTTFYFISLTSLLGGYEMAFLS